MKRLVVTFRTVMKGSKLLFQRARVPPCAREDVRAMCGSILSSELRLEQYEELNIDTARGRSDWNSRGSEIKMKSGLSWQQMLRRSLEILRKPSQFQVIHLKVLFTGASDSSSELSGARSLNRDFQESH